ncbi:MAG TPA: tetratricopeptide repeat protein [Desulfomonilia bacterium]|nr:tetratricopeptide repeat protein [Desulfomonilia bacterium]
MNILIVDDMESMCKAIRSMLKVLNVSSQVLYAYNGLDAWKILTEGETKFDLAIIDWNMPVMTGVELLGKIRDERRLRDLPVIMVTAEANREIVAEAAESDIDAYILKPITVKSLEERVRMVIEKVNNPPPMLYHLKLARDLDEKGDIEKAISEAILAMDANPSSSRPIRELGYLYFKKGDLKQAEKWFLNAAKMNELDVFAVHYLGDLYLKQGDVDKAAQYYDRAMQISPRHLDRGMNLGRILLDKGMSGKAIKVFSKILDLSEDPLTIREDIANICMDKGEYEFAIHLYTFILDQIPNRYDIMSKIVDAYVHLGEAKKAMPYLLEIEKKENKDVRLLLKIAKVYITINQTARADLVLQKVDKIDPGNREAKALLKQCL